jgi:hypothetical protein
MAQMTEQEAETLCTLTPADVMSVYSGKAGRCCCGCAGKHRYSSVHRAVGSTNRGYKVEDKEVNDAQVRRVLGIVQKNAGLATAGGNHFAVVLGERLYVVYPLAS